jgi:hypothetical protein
MENIGKGNTIKIRTSELSDFDLKFIKIGKVNISYVTLSLLIWAF